MNFFFFQKRKSLTPQEPIHTAQKHHYSSIIDAKIVIQIFLHVNFGKNLFLNLFLLILIIFNQKKLKIKKDDHSRVKLSVEEKDETSGYINANYVDVILKMNKYYKFSNFERENTILILNFQRVIKNKTLTLPLKVPCPIRSLTFGA